MNKTRGIIKWTSFSPLPGQEKIITNILNKNIYILKPILSEDQKIEINLNLNKYLKYNTKVLIHYWTSGKIKTEVGIIKKINKITNILLINNSKICIKDILKIEH